VKDCQWQL